MLVTVATPSVDPDGVTRSRPSESEVAWLSDDPYTGATGHRPESAHDRLPSADRLVDPSRRHPQPGDPNLSTTRRHHRREGVTDTHRLSAAAHHLHPPLRGTHGLGCNRRTDTGPGTRLSLCLDACRERSDCSGDDRVPGAIRRGRSRRKGEPTRSFPRHRNTGRGHSVVG